MPPPFNNPLYQLYHLYTWILSGLALMAAPALALDSNSPENRFFESRIRPLFEESCIECHGPEKQKGGITARLPWGLGNGRRVRTGSRARRFGGKQHHPCGSLRDADFQMPPKNKLSAKAIADLEEWVAMGAPDPRTEQPKGPAATKQAGMSIEEGRQFWSFRPIAKPNAPSIQDNSWAKNEIDRFIRAKQEEQGLKPSKPASKSDLVRRAYFSLIGLPPTPEQIDDFVSDPRPDAFDHLVDGLLDSPHFGERWGRHWLDVGRFAESSGGGRTLLFKDAWRYRDYVIESFNANTPFDQFIREQLAGDLLPYDSPAQQSRQLTATAFSRPQAHKLRAAGQATPPL